MYTFAQKPKATQKTTSAKTTLSARARFGHSREVKSILHLQRTIGNQAVQRLLQSKTEDSKENATSSNASTGFAHDFSQIPVHTNTNVQQSMGVQCSILNSKPMQMARGDIDMRGEGDGYELDQRVSAPTPPDHRILCRASATGVSLGASGSINDGTRYGLRTPIIVRGTELGNVLDSELVGASIDHTGSMAARPSARSNNSGFMPADNIPDDRHTSGISDHLSYFDNHGGDGSYSRLQMDLYKIPSCNVTTPWPIANSGYRIKREVKAEGSRVVGIITKTAEDVTIGGHSTTAGLTAKKEAKVTLRS